MTQEERYGTRDLTYSAWHRQHSTKRFLGLERANLLHMIDGDAIEYDANSKRPLAIFETARNIGQFKSTTVTANIGRLAGIRAYVTLYTLADEPNPANEKFQDIASFRVRRLVPSSTDWRTMTPQEYANFLESLRND